MTDATILNVQKLMKVLTLASSDNGHEALAALKVAKNILASAGMDFVSLAQCIRYPSTYEIESQSPYAGQPRRKSRKQ
jgi:hypothetical protein